MLKCLIVTKQKMYVGLVASNEINKKINVSLNHIVSHFRFRLILLHLNSFESCVYRNKMEIEEIDNSLEYKMLHIF